MNNVAPTNNVVLLTSISLLEDSICFEEVVVVVVVAVVVAVWSKCFSSICWQVEDVEERQECATHFRKEEPINLCQSNLETDLYNNNSLQIPPCISN